MAYLDATTRLGPGGGPRAQYVGFAVSVSASITVGALTEPQIVAGGQTIVINLVGDTFAAFNDTIRQAVIDGLDSAQSETLGWNNEVRDKEVVGAVVRDSDTQVTITLSAALSYDITADETITATIPASALTGASPVVGTPTIEVTADAAVTTAKGRRRKLRYVVEVDGQFIQVANISDAQSILQKVRDLATESAERDVKTAIAPKPPKIRVKTSTGKATTSVTLQREVRKTQKAVNHAYIRKARQVAQDLEISQLMIRKIAEEDREDDDAAIMLLL